MTINSYFKYQNDTNHTNEQDLIHNLNAEAIQIKGIDIVYLPRTLQKEDDLFGEDVLSSFSTNYTVEMYIDSIQTFEGEGDLLQKFGMVVKDELNLTVAVRRFQEETAMNVPLEGDLVYFPLSKGLFEIKFVEDEQPFYPLGTLPVYKLRCELFDMSSEEFATGIADIDDILRFDGETGADPYADNDFLETEGDTIQDFDDESPFGSY